MKYVLLTLLVSLLLLLLYGYFRVLYIERNIEFEFGIKDINANESKLLDAIDLGEVVFNSTFILKVINNSNLSINIRDLRVIVNTESNNLSIVSQKIKKVSIDSYKTTPVDIPSEIVIKSSAIGEALALMKGEKLKVNYKVFGKIIIFPIYYEGTIEL